MSDHVPENVSNTKLSQQQTSLTSQQVNVFRPGSTKRRMLREASLIEPTIKNPFVYKVKLSFLDKFKVRSYFIISQLFSFAKLNLFLVQDRTGISVFVAYTYLLYWNNLGNRLTDCTNYYDRIQ